MERALWVGHCMLLRLLRRSPYSRLLLLPLLHQLHAPLSLTAPAAVIYVGQNGSCNVPLLHLPSPKGGNN